MSQSQRIIFYEKQKRLPFTICLFLLAFYIAMRFTFGLYSEL